MWWHIVAQRTCVSACSRSDPVNRAARATAEQQGIANRSAAENNRMLRCKSEEAAGWTAAFLSPIEADYPHPCTDKEKNAYSCASTHDTGVLISP